MFPSGSSFNDCFSCPDALTLTRCSRASWIHRCARSQSCVSCQGGHDVSSLLHGLILLPQVLKRQLDSPLALPLFASRKDAIAAAGGGSCGAAGEQLLRPGAASYCTARTCVSYGVHRFAGRARAAVAHDEDARTPTKGHRYNAPCVPGPLHDCWPMPYGAVTASRGHKRVRRPMRCLGSTAHAVAVRMAHTLQRSLRCAGDTVPLWLGPLPEDKLPKDASAGDLLANRQRLAT
jgi:hypothetical protein